MKKVIAICICLFSVTASVAQWTWSQKANFGAGNTTEARAFSIGNYGYVGGPTPDLWRYDPATDSWSQVASFIGPTRLSPVAFSIGNKGYMGTGGNYNDFYEYDPATNAWTQKANFGGSGREGALGISIDGKGYIGTGGSYLGDWWEYDPNTDSWTQRATLAGPTRYHGGAFAIGSKGYVCTGFNGSFFNDLWEYDPASNSWTQKANMPTVTRDRPVGLAANGKGYILTGWTGGQALNDAWEYDPLTNTWTQLPSMPTAGRYNACGFAINNKLYVGTGYMGGTVSDWWAIGPDCIAQVATQDASCGGTCDGQASVSAPLAGAVSSYLWSDGQTTPTAVNLCAGSYTVAITDTTGCTSITAFTITEPVPVTAIAVVTEPTCAGDSNGSICAIPNANQVSYLWATGDTTSCLLNMPAGVYTLTVTDSLTNCSGTIAMTLTEPDSVNINFNYNNATCQTCPNGSASAQVTGGTPPLSYQWSTGATLAFQNNLLPGVYTVCVTDANGCSSCDSISIGYTTSLSDVLPEGMTVGPNPFSSEIKISWSSPELAVKDVMVSDVTGRWMQTEKVMEGNHISISTGHFSAGVYTMEINTSRQRYFVKVLKN